MKITDMIISAILKKGIIYEARNVDVEFDIPTEMLYHTKEGDIFKKNTIHIKADHMSIQIDKGETEA